MIAKVSARIDKPVDAETLAKGIRKYWADRGFRVETRVEGSDGARGVRSDMINGYPQTKAGGQLA